MRFKVHHRYRRRKEVSLLHLAFCCQALDFIDKAYIPVFAKEEQSTKNAPKLSLCGKRIDEPVKR